MRVREFAAGTGDGGAKLRGPDRRWPEVSLATPRSLRRRSLACASFAALRRLRFAANSDAARETSGRLRQADSHLRLLRRLWKPSKRINRSRTPCASSCHDNKKTCTNSAIASRCYGRRSDRWSDEDGRRFEGSLITKQGAGVLEATLEAFTSGAYEEAKISSGFTSCELTKEDPQLASDSSSNGDFETADIFATHSEAKCRGASSMPAPALWQIREAPTAPGP